MQGPYQEHVRDAPDVCSNCFRVTRIERIDPVMSRDGLRHELDSHYARDRRETSVEYHDGGDEPTRAKGVFCNCGVEGIDDRIWTTATYPLFKTFVFALIRTLEHKDVDFVRGVFMRQSYSNFRAEIRDRGLLLPVLPQKPIDKALSQALDQAIAQAAASNSETDRQEARRA